MEDPMTIDDFCKRYGISRYTYYRVRRRGDGPRETRLGHRRSVILPPSLREWERQTILPKPDAEPAVPGKSQEVSHRAARSAPPLVASICSMHICGGRRSLTDPSRPFVASAKGDGSWMDNGRCNALPAN